MSGTVRTLLIGMLAGSSLAFCVRWWAGPAEDPRSPHLRRMAELRRGMVRSVGLGEAAGLFRARSVPGAANDLRPDGSSRPWFELLRRDGSDADVAIGSLSPSQLNRLWSAEQSLLEAEARLTEAEDKLLGGAAAILHEGVPAAVCVLGDLRVSAIAATESDADYQAARTDFIACLERRRTALVDTLGREP